MPGGFAFDQNAMRARDEINDALSVMQQGAMAAPMRPQMPQMQPQMGQMQPMQPQMQPMQPQTQQMQPQMPQMGAPMGSMRPPMAAQQPFKKGGRVVSKDFAVKRASGGGAWTRKEGKNPEGGLNAKGRASLKAQGQDIKPPVSAKQAAKSPKSAARRKSFCARSAGQAKMFPNAARDPDSRLNKARRKWDCKAEGGAVKPVWDKDRPEDLGEPKSLSVKKKKSAKARAAAAGRPYPNLVDNMAAARKKGK